MRRFSRRLAVSLRSTKKEGAHVLCVCLCVCAVRVRVHCLSAYRSVPSVRPVAPVFLPCLLLMCAPVCVWVSFCVCRVCVIWLNRCTPIICQKKKRGRGKEEKREGEGKRRRGVRGKEEENAKNMQKLGVVPRRAKIFLVNVEASSL